MQPSNGQMDYKAILGRKDDAFVTRVFNMFKEPGSDGLLIRSKLLAAFRELGVFLQEKELDEIFVFFDVDKNGGLDLDEFKNAVRHPSDTEQWTDRLPLSSLLAQAMMTSRNGLDSLQNVSSLTGDELDEILVKFCEECRKLVFDAVCELKTSCEVMEKLESSRSLGNCKFGTGGAEATLKGGRVDDFHEGLSKRIGESWINAPVV